jgi:glutathione S-transferase
VEFVELKEAKERPGLRLVTVAGIPSPWSEAAKGMFRVKQVPLVGVRLQPGRPEVSEWTSVPNAPVAMYDDEPPRSGWAEILLLAERLAPDPRLIPADPEERALLFGLAHEICGEMGLGWARRLHGIHLSFESEGRESFPLAAAQYLAPRYGYRPDNGVEARRRVIEVLGLLARRLHAQREAGSRFYLGEELSALDLYSAAFMGMFRPLPPEQCPMPEALRKAFETVDAGTQQALDPLLLEHRDAVYRESLELPMTL